ncbi:hypothetical protein [Gymnodinialimonas sp. 57CJ19]|uniref:hypothetical protein n=1 Tax=Gymnodinialimonas sp. 57CJ19 TaxID=3138498 RepID=UPI0031346045
MEGGNAMGVAFAVIYGGYTLILLVICGVALLLIAKGFRALGIGLLAAVVAWCVIPPIIDRVAGLADRRAIDAVNLLPDTVELTGRNILVIDLGGGFGERLVQLGVDANVYVLSTTSPERASPAPHRVFETLQPREAIQRYTLGDPVEDLGGARFPERHDIPENEIPPFDLVIMDDNAYLRSYAPDMLHLPDDLLRHAQVNLVVFQGWSDPFTTLPPEPILRSVTPWHPLRAFIYWPFSVDDSPYPQFAQRERVWNHILCQQAGAPEDRAAFSYDYYCGPNSLLAHP